MSDYNADAKNGSGRIASTNHSNATIALSRAARSEMGALELEYPESAGLYGAVFERHLPEVADELIDTRVVRMLVEMEFNCRRVQRMFDQLAVGEETRLALELIRRDVEALLWSVCDVLSAEYREEWGYESSRPAREWGE